LEDEPSTHRGRWLVLAVLLIGAAAAGWHWRGNVRSLASRLSAETPASQAQSTANAAPVAPTPPTAAASNGAEPSTPPAGAASNTQTAPPSSPAPTPTAAPASDQTTVPLASTSKPAAPEASQAAAQPTETPAAGAAVPPAASDSPQSANADAKDQANGQSAEDSAAAGSLKSAAANSAKPARTTADQVPDGSESDALESQGEKYLYGNGVAANCALAQRSLLAAAERSSARAQSVLGTMYATGHCAARDLPLAYRWFARALRQDPSNARIEQDLKVLWNQMSPDERQVALKAER